jgi:DNA-binding XRE family transcriptional regulator
MPNAIPNLLTMPEIQRLLGERLKALRLDAGLKRTTLARRSGVSARTLQRFEDTSEVSLKNLLRLVHALGRLAEFGALLELPAARTLHTMTVRGEVANPTREDMLRLAPDFDIRPAQAKEILERTREAVADWADHADSAGVSSGLRKDIEAVL